MTAKLFVDIARRRAEQNSPSPSLVPLYTRLAIAEAEETLEEARLLADLVMPRAV